MYDSILAQVYIRIIKLFGTTLCRYFK